MRMARGLPALVCAGLLAGCSTAQDLPLVGTLFGGGQGPTAEVVEVSSNASAFDRQLAAEYSRYAAFEANEMLDIDSPRLFADRARLAAAGQQVPPLDPGEAGIESQAALSQLTDARQQLVAALDQGRARAPEPAAIAQARYDCWVEQTAEGWQENDIRACATMFRQALQEVQVASAPPTTQPATDTPYLVFFDFDEANITPTARTTIQQIVTDFRSGAIDGIDITGYTDTVGSVPYNQALSIDRAEAVRDALVAQGIPANRIQIAGEGQSNLLVPTADEVREASNRRAEIRVQ